MILLDSNLLIYLRDPRFSTRIAGQLAGQRLATCNIVIAEVLGYPRLGADDASYYQNFFAALKNYPFDEAVTQQTVAIRRTTTVQLSDAIIAATALANNIPLWTHNSRDFQKIAGLQLFDPLA